MKSTEQAISNIFYVLSFVTIFILRVIVGAIKLGICVYRSVQEQTALTEEQIIEISEPITKALKSEAYTKSQILLISGIKTVFKSALKTVLYLYNNTPQYWSETKNVSWWLWNVSKNKLARLN